jgi:arylsulfatase A
VPTPDSDDWQPGPGSTSTHGDKQYFADMVAHIDKLVGKLQDKLKELGLEDNTIFIFTGDNGTFSGINTAWNGTKVKGGKKTITDRGTRVPMIAQWPRQGVAGVVNEDLISFSDFFPTLCEAAGASIPEDLPIDGRSFLPVLDGREFTPRETSYLWYKPTNPSDLIIIARTKFYKLFGDGTFVKVEYPEERPIASAEMTDEERAIQEKLQAVLDRYAQVPR